MASRRSARTATRRHTDPAQARRLIRRRGGWLLLFGVVHVVLLYSGDVIGAYGAFAVMFAGVVSWSGRRLGVVLAITLAVGAAGLALLQLVAVTDASLAVGPTLLDSALLRMSGLPALPIAALSMAPSVLIGVWAGRRRLLEQPDRNGPVLRRVALIGLPVAVLGAQPVALQAVGVWTPGTSGAAALATAVFSATGILGGLAYMAVIALVADRIGERRGRVTSALVALGRRSMTFYIAQSPVWLVLIEPSLLGLGGELGAARAAGIAVLTWVVTAVVADALERAGRRGPAETLLRRLTYRPRPV